MGNTLCWQKRRSFEDDFEAYNKRVDKPSNDRPDGIPTKNANEALHSDLPTDINSNDKLIDDEQLAIYLTKDLMKPDSHTKLSVPVAVSSQASIDTDSLADEQSTVFSAPTFLSPASTYYDHYLSAVELTSYESVDEDERSVDERRCMHADVAENCDETVRPPADIDAETPVEHDSESSVDAVVDDTIVPTLSISHCEPSDDAADTPSAPPVPSCQFKIPLQVNAHKKRHFSHDQVLICHGEFARNQSTPTKTVARLSTSLTVDDRQITCLPTPLRDNLVSPTRKVEELCDDAGRPLTDTPTRKYFDQKRSKSRV